MGLPVQVGSFLQVPWKIWSLRRYRHARGEVFLNHWQHRDIMLKGLTTLHSLYPFTSRHYFLIFSSETVIYLSLSGKPFASWRNTVVSLFNWLKILLSSPLFHNPATMEHQSLRRQRGTLVKKPEYPCHLGNWICRLILA